MVLSLNTKEKEDLLKAINLLILEERKPDENFVKRIVALKKKIEKSLGKIKPGNGKKKGMEYQKKICTLISELTGIEYDQKDDECLIHSREAGLNGVDIILRGECRKRFPYSCEVKNCNNISLPAWIAQAKQNETDKEKFLLFIHSQSIDEKDVVVMSLDTFRNMYKIPD